MQVKKFEAKTMKEALDLVKTQLGPEAIILSAKDTQRGFGLLGEKSVEVTAAVSDETLRKKKLAEAKMRDDLRERFQQIPASRQRQYINKVFQGREEREAVLTGAGVQAGNAQARKTAVEPVPAELRTQLKGLRYIDIEDEDYGHGQGQRGHGHGVQGSSATYGRGSVPPSRQRPALPVAVADPAAGAVPVKRSARVIAAAAAAANAAKATFAAPPAQSAVASAHAAHAAAQFDPAGRSNEVMNLESQVRELRSLVERFQNMPQISLSMHPGAEQGLPFELSAAYQLLTAQGIQAHSVVSLLRKAQKELDSETLKKPALVNAWLVRHLLNMIEVSGNPTGARYHVFMGSTGQGKSTTLVKFASHLMMEEKKTIAIISLDTMKLGAADQMRLYAQILNVPFALVRSQEEWAIAEQRLARVQHILVDCPGLSLRSQEEVNWLRRMLPPATLVQAHAPEFTGGYGGAGVGAQDKVVAAHFVQSVLARDEETSEIAGRYQAIGFDDVIFTRLDESSRQGLMLNFQERFKVPLHSYSVGTRIPEDYEFASKERVIDFLFKLSKATRREDSI